MDNKVTEFLAENNICGQSILQLVSRGNAVIAELLRLKDYVPNVFRLDNKQDLQRYGDIILDFGYFKVAEAHEHKIENNEGLRDLDEEFKENHIKIISRFYLVFEGIHSYVTDLNNFLDELDEGIYIHQSIETVFGDIEGRQLMCESLYLYGLMLLMVDAHIDGMIRERLLVAYYRYTPQRRDTQSCIEEVCKLLRDTGNKRPPNYPEDYFRRITIKSVFIDIAIGRLRSDDIYNQLSVYPLPKHRSVALSTQASMLYVCLFFAPDILHNRTAIMREVVDKYFPDNWVISLYMGFAINIVESWENFKAAKLALNNTLETVNVKSYANFYGSTVPELLTATAQLLKEGNVTSKNVIQDINNICNVLRACNVTLRWLLLHTSKSDQNKKCKQLRELVLQDSRYNAGQLFKLLLNTAQLELNTKEIVKNLLAEKEVIWEKLKTESCDSLLELADVFGGTKPLTRIEKNVNLERWFREIAEQVKSLESTNSSSARKIANLIQALEEVQEFHQLENKMHVIQFLAETRKFLHQMFWNMNIKEDVLITLQIIADVSYAWELIDSYTAIMQLGIKREPTLCIKLRAVFLKLASTLELPLLRINQARSQDLMSVSQYYSSELEIYVRKVLQIIPETMFEKMARIIEMQTSVIKELPTRLDKDKLKDYAQLNERFEFAELTHSISVYSEGMRMMKSTLVGVVCLDPKKLLEDGIRKELVQHISKALHTGLSFSTKSKPEELEQKLKALAQVMDGYKRSFEYIQDYVNINGLKIWQEEVTRIVNFNVEQECNGFLRTKVHSWESAYQSRYVPIPHYPSTDNVSRNFIGRLARELIRLTDPRNSIYIEQTSTWYDKGQKPILNRQIFTFIMSAVEVTGLVGLDRLFSFMIITHLKKVFAILENKNGTLANIIGDIGDKLKELDEEKNAVKFYQNSVSRMGKLWNDMLDGVLSIGQLQLLRVLIAFQLNMSCRFDAKNMASSLSVLNTALVNDAKCGIQLSDKLLSTISPYLDYTGMNNPLNKIYLTVRHNIEHGSTLFYFTLSNLQKLFLPKNPGNINKDHLDGISLIVGVHTVLKQFNPVVNKKFIENMSQFAVLVTNQSIQQKGGEVPTEAVIAVKFLEIYTTYSEDSHDCFLTHMPEELLQLHHSLTTLAI